MFIQTGMSVEGDGPEKTWTYLCSGERVCSGETLEGAECEFQHSSPGKALTNSTSIPLHFLSVYF